MTVGDLTERDVIAHVQQRLPPNPEWVRVGIGDDAAVVEPARNRVEVFTVDALVEGVHFDRTFTPPSAIGHRALAVNLSDLAAMGAEPRLALLSLAIPPALPVTDFDAMLDGLVGLAARSRIQVVGGNVTRSPGPLVIDVTATGTLKRRQVLTRGGGRTGDELYVTGEIGAAAAGLELLSSGASVAGERAALVNRFLYPEPRLRTGIVVARHRAASACMDLSDGLADAVAQIAAASGTGALIEAASLPVPPAATAWFTSVGKDPVESAVVGGDDYELLFAVRPRQRRAFLAAAAKGQVPVTRIGLLTPEPAVVLRREDGRTSPMAHGFHHFR